MLEMLLWAAAAVGTGTAGYVGYKAVTKGVPAAWAMLKGWWTAADAELATIKADIQDLKLKVAAFEQAGKAAPAPAVAPAAPAAQA